MDEHQLKVEVARAQISSATYLFLRDRDPISIHVLACGACELLEGIGQEGDVEVLSALVMKHYPDLKFPKVKRIRNQYWNAMKHFYEKNNKTVRNDTELLNDFSDVVNDTVIWQAWHDYQLITKRLPIEAQVLQLWYFAINENKLAEQVDRKPYRQAFPGIGIADRIEQKRRLRRACEKYRKDSWVKRHPKTEPVPLMNRLT